MNKQRPRITLAPLGDPQHFGDLLALRDDLTLWELLKQAPALSTEPIEPEWLARPLHELFISAINETNWDRPLYRPPGLVVTQVQPDGAVASTQTGSPAATSTPANAATPDSVPVADAGMPQSISKKDAVLLAYAREIDGAASFLRGDLSALVICDKLVVEHLWKEMVRKAHLEPRLLEVGDEGPGELIPRGLRQRQLAGLKELIKTLKKGQVLVVPHLDLLAGGDSSLQTEARELIELLYAASDQLLLAFADPSLVIPEVLAKRFAVRLEISGVWSTVVYPDGTEKPIGEALITASEAAHFTGFDPEGLYKNVAGMDPIRLRDAITYAVHEHAHDEIVPVNKLYEAIRAFKAQTSAKFEVPHVTFTEIGGYEEVKAELLRAIRLLAGSYNLPNEKLRNELIPRGFIFHGPPGTGKTLFAKAIASQLNATIQVVSGPEVTDMYVGESERKVRELFAEARRNAPAVLVFDEFDSIAAQRSGRDDGGSRAGNAMVAQILTEMDGFRPDVPLLIIGTTNRLDIIDEALLRPSRFKAIAIGLPNLTARRAIAQVHAAHFGIGVSPALLDVIAAATEGMSGDDIRSLFRDACVGLFCEDPPLVADAQRFGRLVGLLRKAKQQRDAKVAQYRTTVLTTGRPGERPRPTSTMFALSAATTPVTLAVGEGTAEQTSTTTNGNQQPATPSADRSPITTQTQGATS